MANRCANKGPANIHICIKANRTPFFDIVEKLASTLGVEYKVLFEKENSSKDKGKSDFSKHLLETKLISAITKTIHNEFKLK